MSCPYSADRAIELCPFLREVCAREGPAFAKHIATQPAKRFGGPVLEECGDFAATFSLFHGPRGIVPLKTQAPEASSTHGEPLCAKLRCRRAALLPRVKSDPAQHPSPRAGAGLTTAPVARETADNDAAPKPSQRRATIHPLAASSASISLGGFGFLVRHEPQDSPVPGTVLSRPWRLAWAGSILEESSSDLARDARCMGL